MQILKQILFACIAFLITLGVCETYIRSTYIANVSLTEFNPEIGKVRRKNIDYLFFNEGFGIGKVNELGYLGESCIPEKPENTIRIALLGDSFIESFQIFQRSYFGNIARMKLSEKYPDKHFELLNFGNAGFEITDMYAYQKTRLEKFHPDFIFYLIANDDLIPEYSDLLKQRTILKNDSLIISSDFNPVEVDKFKKAIFLLQKITILNMLNDCRTKTKIIPVASVILDKIYPWFFNPEGTDDVSDNARSNNLTDPLTAKIIESLDPKKVIIINRDDAKLPAGFISLCRNNGLSYFDLSPLLDQLKKSGNDPQAWKVTKKHGHWNVQAHSAIGAEISDIVSFLIEKDP